MSAGSPLKTLLAEQVKGLDLIGQHAVPPREFLTTISPLLNDGSPARSRGASANSSRRGVPSPVSPPKSEVSNPRIASDSSAAQSPSALVAIGAVPVAPNAYMNDMPLAPYGSTSHLALHVTETLELALRVLRKNQQVGRQLTERDQRLLADIASFVVLPSEGDDANQGAAVDASANPVLQDDAAGVQAMCVPL